jgi:hypothetical protein
MKREEAPAAQIVKAVTALEALVMTGEHIEIAAEVSGRAAAICFDPERDSSFDEVYKEMSNAFDMRSRLAHGSLSPFNAEVTRYAPQCLYWAERAIGGALVLFESHGLLDRDLSRMPERQFISGKAFHEVTHFAHSPLGFVGEGRCSENTTDRCRRHEHDAVRFIVLEVSQALF